MIFGTARMENPPLIRGGAIPFLSHQVPQKHHRALNRASQSELALGALNITRGQPDSLHAKYRSNFPETDFEIVSLNLKFN